VLRGVDAADAGGQRGQLHGGLFLEQRHRDRGFPTPARKSPSGCRSPCRAVHPARPPASGSCAEVHEVDPTRLAAGTVTSGWRARCRGNLARRDGVSCPGRRDRRPGRRPGCRVGARHRPDTVTVGACRWATSVNVLSSDLSMRRAARQPVSSVIADTSRRTLSSGRSGRTSCPSAGRSVRESLVLFHEPNGSGRTEAGVPPWVHRHSSLVSCCGRRCAPPGGVFSRRGARRTVTYAAAPLGSKTPPNTVLRRPRDERR
jgi:hypothetical protein